MTERYIVNGTLSNQTLVILDKPIALPAGRVRITVEPLPSTTFWTGATVAELAEAQGVKPIETLDELKADFWPEDESLDDFIETIYQWRREEVEL
jgi:hypothetical protein